MNLKELQTALKNVEKIKAQLEKEIIRKNSLKPHCKKCLSGFVYHTKKGLICRRCGGLSK